MGYFQNRSSPNSYRQRPNLSRMASTTSNGSYRNMVHFKLFGTKTNFCDFVDQQGRFSFFLQIHDFIEKWPRYDFQKSFFCLKMSDFRPVWNHEKYATYFIVHESWIVHDFFSCKNSWTIFSWFQKSIFLYFVLVI